MVVPEKNNRAADDLVVLDTGFGFKKTDRLLKRSDFKCLNKVGRQVQGRFFIIRYRYRPSSDPFTASRLGVTVSRRVGNAVVRNRTRRMVREFFRCHRDLLPRFIDLNVIARSDAAGQPHHLLSASLRTLFEKIKARENA